MSVDTFREQARQLLAQMLDETPRANRDEVLDAYADALVKLYSLEAHQMLTEIIEDARTRLDARLSPDPIRQTIASVTTTFQDMWRALWEPPRNPDA